MRVASIWTNEIGSWYQRGVGDSRLMVKLPERQDALLFATAAHITSCAIAIFPRGVTLAELGREHFLLDAQIDVTTVALMTTVMRWLEEPSGKISQRP